MVGGVSERKSFLGINYATNSQTGGITLLNNKGVDAKGAKHLTSGQRQAQIRDGFNKAKTSASDQLHKNQASAANAKAKATYANAAANGTITRYEKTQIGQANRKAGIANKQVSLDKETDKLGRMQINYAKDGKITKAESQALTNQKTKIGGMQKEIKQLKNKDAKLTKGENKYLNSAGGKFGNAIDNAFGKGQKVGGGFRPGRMPRPQLPSRPTPPRIGRPRIGGGSSTRLGRNIAADNGRLRFTNNQGIDSRGTKHLYGSERRNMVQQGNAKANYGIQDWSNQMKNNQAQNNVNQTIGNAYADGRVTRFESRDIQNAQREAGISGKQVNVDTARRQLGGLEAQFARDGKLTIGERRQLTEARSNLGKLQGELNTLKSQDASADKADAAFKANPFNQFMNSIEGGGFPRPFEPSWQPQPMPRPSFDLFGGIGGAISGGIQGLLGGGALGGIFGGIQGGIQGGFGGSISGSFSANWSASSSIRF